MGKMLTQVKLVRPKGDGTASLTTWVDADPRLTRGRVITLKKDAQTYMVEEVYSTMPVDSISNYGWDNNDYSKHEGLKFK